MLKSSLCGYSDSYILARRTITITGAGADERNKELAFKKLHLPIA